MTAVSTSEKSSTNMDTLSLLGKHQLKEVSDIKNALNTNAAQMASVMKYAFFEGITFDKVIERIFGLINNVDANTNSDVLKVSLLDPKAVLISNIILSQTERCFQFSVGATTVLIYFALVGKSGIAAQIRLKVSIAGVTLMDQNMGKFLLGESKTIYYSNGISFVNPTIKFGANNQLVAKIYGAVGLPPFSATFGEYTKKIDLNMSTNNNIVEKVHDEKAQETSVAAVESGPHYIIGLQNESGAASMVGIFQTDPNNQQGGFPVIWACHGMENTQKTSFEWQLDWSLCWLTTEEQLSNGGNITIKNSMSVNVDPSGATSNTATVSYSKEYTTYNIVNGPINASLQNGNVTITTSASTFTVSQAVQDNLYLGVYMGANLVFCIAGRPGLTYTFGTHPTYYISPYIEKANAVVTASAIGNATKAEFNGTFALGFQLTEQNKFVSTTPPNNPNN